MSLNLNEPDIWEMWDNGLEYFVKDNSNAYESLDWHYVTPSIDCYINIKDMPKLKTNMFIAFKGTVKLIALNL